MTKMKEKKLNSYGYTPVIGDRFSNLPISPDYMTHTVK